MKTKLFIILFIAFLSINGQAQTAVDNAIIDNTYAIIQVSSPQTVFGVFEIKISYGNGKIEDFKDVEFSRKNKVDLINEVTNALNYMAAKGYVLKHTLTYNLPTANIQYVFEKK